jgi:YEATS domain-containing protein 4
MSSGTTEPQDSSTGGSPNSRRRRRPSASNAASKILAGVTVSRPFVYGSTAMYLGKRHEFGNDTHRWTFYLRGLHGEDLSYLFKKVVFQLHPSCSEPLVVLTEPPFQVTQTGWGEFDGQIIMHLRDDLMYSNPRDQPLDR